MGKKKGGKGGGGVQQGGGAGGGGGQQGGGAGGGGQGRGPSGFSAGGSEKDFPSLGGPPRGQGRPQQQQQQPAPGMAVEQGRPQQQQQPAPGIAAGQGRPQQQQQQPAPGMPAGQGRPQQQQQPAPGMAAGQGRPQQQQQASAGQGRPQAQPTATPQQQQTGAVGGAVGGATAGGGESVLEQVTRQMERAKLQGAAGGGGGGGGMVPPEKRLKGQFPGKAGKNIKISVNHFPVTFKSKQVVIYMYHITIKPPWDRPYRKRDTELYFEVFAKWKQLVPEVKKAPYAWVFNGNNIIYSTRSIDRIRDVEDIPVPGDNQELKFAVRDVRKVQAIDITEELRLFSENGRRALDRRNEVGMPQDALNALDVVMGQSVRTNPGFDTVGRSFFRTHGHVLDVGFGKEVWVGTFTSMRPFGWKPLGYLLTLNVDLANKPAIKNLHLIHKTGNQPCYAEEVLSRGRQSVDVTKGLTEYQLDELERDMKGLKVRYELPNGIKRCYKFNKFVQAANKQIILDLKKTVQEYFKEQHKVSLRYPHLPCLHLGAIDKTIYIPMEFCSMERQPMPRGKKLNEESTSKMIRSTAVKPLERQNKILQGLRENNAIYLNNPYAQEFGISVADKMAQINGRVLKSPAIAYRDNKEVTIRSPGSWRPDRGCAYVNGQNLKYWAMLDLAGVDFGTVVEAFARVGRENGLTVDTTKDNLWHQKSSDRTLEKDFREIVEAYRKDNLPLQLIMVVFPFKAGKLYDTVKYLGDIEFKIPTQCILQKVLFKMGSINLQVVSNVCLKINSKLGGINHVLAQGSRPATLTRPVMVMGADVSHAAPADKGEKPSIVAVVGSMDPKASLYECEVRVQRSGQNEEIIHDMKNITENLLRKFYNKTGGRRPEKIIMFRDGVSEGQFLKVLAAELNAMRQACMALDPEYKPKITYLVVQKRHHTRFFPLDKDKENCYERSGNVLAGTVVDQGINHPTEGDFYLVSHEGIQGTSRPTHYQILWDDSDLQADELEQLTFYLCHLYSRCTRSVSYPTPTYYAHLAADRARSHHNDLIVRRVADRDDKLGQSEIKIMYFV